MWYQIFIPASRFECGTKYSFKLKCRIEGKIKGIIEGIIVSRTIVRVQASEYGCHTFVAQFWPFFGAVLRYVDILDDVVVCGKQ